MRAPHTRWLLGASILAAAGVTATVALLHADPIVATDGRSEDRWNAVRHGAADGLVEHVIAPTLGAEEATARPVRSKAQHTAEVPEHDDAAQPTLARVRIDLPTGTPADERLVVRTRRHRHGPATIVQLDDDQSFPADGRYELWVELKGRYAYLEEPVRISSKDLRANQPYVITPRLGARIVGDVMADRSVWSRRRLAEFRIVVEPLESEGPHDPRGASPIDRDVLRVKTKRLGQEGAFDVGPLPTDTRYEVRLIAAQPLPCETHTVSVQPGRTSFVSVALNAGVAVTGTVMAAGAPLAQRTIKLDQRSSDGVWSEVHSTRSNRSGQFEFTGLPAGQLRVRLESPHMLAKPIDLGTLDHHDVASGVLVLARLGRRIDGCLYGPDGRPLASTVVTAQVIVEISGDPLALGSTRIARTDSTGRFLFQGLGADEYELTAQADAGPAGAFHARETVQAGRLGLDLRMRTGPLPPNASGLLCFE